MPDLRGFGRLSGMTEARDGFSGDLMAMDIQKGIVRGLPLTLLLTFLIQMSTAVWWVSAKTRDSAFVEQRVDRLELVVSRSGETQGVTIDRLARIEERLNSQYAMLSRIEKQISGKNY